MSEQKEFLFSVVVPTYNRANLIMETLESVFAQTYPNYEILVVDNCSTDNTQEILQGLVDQERIRYIRNERNFERAYSRNVGMANAKGDYLTLLDSDDFIYPDALKDANDFIHANPDCKVFQFKSEVVNDKREVVYTTPYPSLKNQYKALCSGNFMSAIGGYIHRDLYTKYKFNEDPKMIGAEDYEFWFQIFARHKVSRIDKINAGAREHPNRSVHTGVYEHLEYQRNKMMDIIREDPLLYEKFGKYSGRLYASYLLQEIFVHKRNYSVSKRLGIIIDAAKNDFSILFTKRYLAILINIFR